MPDGAILQSPTVLPGQIWLIEHNPETALSALDRDALAQANVVLYERALAPLVAEALPLGGYAEPLPVTGPALSRRALVLAEDGWSVMQLVAARASQRARLHTVSSRPNGAGACPPGPAHAFTANGLAG